MRPFGQTVKSCNGLSLKNEGSIVNYIGEKCKIAERIMKHQCLQAKFWSVNDLGTLQSVDNNILSNFDEGQKSSLNTCARARRTPLASGVSRTSRVRVLFRPLFCPSSKLDNILLSTPGRLPRWLNDQNLLVLEETHKEDHTLLWYLLI